MSQKQAIKEAVDQILSDQGPYARNEHYGFTVYLEDNITDLQISEAFRKSLTAITKHIPAGVSVVKAMITVPLGVNIPSFQKSLIDVYKGKIRTDNVSKFEFILDGLPYIQDKEKDRWGDFSFSEVAARIQEEIPYVQDVNDIP